MPRYLSMPNLLAPAFPLLTSPFIHTRAREVAGHLAQCVFQGWCAISERARRTIPRLFENKKVKSRIAVPVALVFFFVLPTLGGIDASLVRQPGSSLDPSIRNETEHAVDLATAWLAARQSADGSWGSETGRAERTAIALLALTARKKTRSDALARAAVWLDAHPPSGTNDPSAHAWRIIALLSAVPDTPARSNLTQRLMRDAQSSAPTTNAWFFGQLLWNDARALAGQPTPPLSSDRTRTLLKSESEKWPPDDTAPDGLWRSAHLINRTANGVLERDGQPLDWRRDIAQRLIATQRRDPAGGGYWGLTEGDSRIRQTAFGVLTLLEL